MWVISLPLAVAVCLCAEPIVRLLAGDDFLAAALPMRVLIWVAVLSFLSRQLRFLFMALGKQRLFARLVIAVFLLEVAIELVLIPRWGYLGACAGTVVGELVFTLAGLWLCRRVGIGPVEWKPLAHAALAALGMAALLWPARDATLPALALVVALAGMGYTVLCLALGALRWDELLHLYDSLPGAGGKNATPFPSRPGRCRSRGPSSAPSWTWPSSAQARGWMEQLESEGAPPPRPIDRTDLENGLGEPIRACELWRSSWRTRVYRVRRENGETLVVKQLCVAPESELTQEFATLNELAGLRVPGLQVPRPVALLPGHNAYVMEVAHRQGPEVGVLERQGPRPRASLRASRRRLAELHLRWTENVRPVPTAGLADDLAAIPGGFTKVEWAMLRRTLDQVGRMSVAVGRVYLDFKASNVFFQDGTVTLIDPPERRHRTLLLWDVATFLRYLRWQVWKAHLLRPWRPRHALVEQGLAAFQRKYVQVFARYHTRAEVPPLLLDVLQLQQTGQILALQEGKLRLARRDRGPLNINGRLAQETTAALASLPMLRLQKRRLLRRIARATEAHARLDRSAGTAPPEDSPRPRLAAFARLVQAVVEAPAGWWLRGADRGGRGRGPERPACPGFCRRPGPDPRCGHDPCRGGHGGGRLRPDRRLFGGSPGRGGAP